MKSLVKHVEVRFNEDRYNELKKLAKEQKKTLCSFMQELVDKIIKREI